MASLHENHPQSKARTDAQRGYTNLGLVTARAAHATPEAVVTRRRHLLAVEGGHRNVAEDAAVFVFSSRGAKIVAGRDASAAAVDALRRNAFAAERAQPQRREAA